jgi:hypothetical protein
VGDLLGVGDQGRVCPQQCDQGTSPRSEANLMVSADGPDFLAMPLSSARRPAGVERSDERALALVRRVQLPNVLSEPRCGVHHASMLSGRHATVGPVVSSADSARGCIALTEAPPGHLGG